MPKAFRTISGKVKSRYKTPLWTYTGITLLLIFIGICLYNYQRNKAHVSKFVSSPVKGDVYEVETGYRHYTLYKVDSVGEASVFVRKHIYETNSEAGLPDLRSKDSFDVVTYELSKIELNKMRKRNKILTVHR